MSSINTNLSAMTALQALKATQSAMNKNQNQISTGLRVGEAADNASYWSIATSMKSDNGALGAVKDSIKQSKAMINTFTSAMDKTLTYLNKMKEGLVAAHQPGADLKKIQTEFKANIEGMKSAANSASFNGQNWLSGASGNVELVTSYDGVNNKVGTLSINTSQTNLIGGPNAILNDALSINISTVAPNASATIALHQPATTTTTVVTPATPGSVTFSPAQVDPATDFAVGADLTWTTTSGGTETYVFDGTEDTSNIKSKIEALYGSEVVVTWDATDGLTISGANVADNVSATFTRPNTTTVTPTPVNPVAEVTTTTPVPAEPGTAVFAPDQLEIAEGNTITWTAGGVEKTYTMVAGETTTSLALALDGFSADEEAAWDPLTGLTITAGTLTGDVTGASFKSGELIQALKYIDEAIASVTEGSAMLGANKALLETQESFIGVLSDSLTAGVSAFVDADMNEASTRNQALQTQQQLGVQALSMANQNSQMILKLFQ
jgi:flagellin